MKILKKSDFYDFNEAHDIRDSKGNVRRGMVGLFYKQVCSFRKKIDPFDFI